MACFPKFSGKKRTKSVVIFSIFSSDPIYSTGNIINLVLGFQRLCFYIIDRPQGISEKLVLQLKSKNFPSERKLFRDATQYSPLRGSGSLALNFRDKSKHLKFWQICSINKLENLKKPCWGLKESEADFTLSTQWKMKNLKLNFNQNILIQNIGTIRFIWHRFRMHSFQAPIYLSSIDQRISDLLNKFSGSSYIVHW